MRIDLHTLIGNSTAEMFVINVNVNDGISSFFSSMSTDDISMCPVCHGSLPSEF